MAVLFGCVAFCHLALAFLLFFNRARTPRLEAVAVPPTSSVLVVVPARNEEHNIGDCVSAILLQDYPRGLLSVRVVDDHSTDRTRSIIQALAQRDSRLSMVLPPPLPAGWLGKPHAVYHGAFGAQADYLLFVDADVRLARDAVSRAVVLADRTRAGLTTVMPKLCADSFWERATQPVIGLLLYGLLDPVRVNDPHKQDAAGFGPFMLFHRQAYETLGGHEAVRHEIIEDLRLAQKTKEQGLGLLVAHGTGSVCLRMYDSLASLVAGWSKNFFVVLGKAKGLAPVFALVLTAVFALPTVGVWATLTFAAVRGHFPEGAALPLLAYAADWLARLSLWRNYDVTPRGVRSLGGLVVAYILCLSAYRAAFGKTQTWRGRTITT